MKSKPTTLNQNDGSTPTIDAITNKEKWAILMAKQALMKVPYNMLSCLDYGEVISEIDVYVAAEKLDIMPLKEVSLNKISAWFKMELQAGLPLSDEVRTCATYILRGHKDIARSFIELCAKHLPVVERDCTLTSLIEGSHPETWKTVVSIRAQCTKEIERLREDLRERKAQVLSLETYIDRQEAASANVEKIHQFKEEATKRSLALAERRAEAAQAMVNQLEAFNRSLQQELLSQKASALKIKENNQAPNQKQVVKYDASAQQLQKKVVNLKKEVAGKEQALRQSKSGNEKVKNDLRVEINRLYSDKESLYAANAKIKDAFKMLMDDINRTGHCEGCSRNWNIKIGHQQYTSMSATCKLCNERTWYHGQDN